MRRIGAGLSFLGCLGLAVAACDGDPDLSTPESAAEALAEEECGFRERCCGEETGISQGTSCDEGASERWLRYFEDVSPGKGEYPFDPACVEPLLTLFQGTCDGELLYDPTTLCEIGFCAAGFYHGDKQEGEACVEGLECDGPFQCVGGYCQSPCGLQEGSLCADADGNQVRNCRAELYCDQATRFCAAFPVAGQACPSGICAAGAYCEPELQICRNTKSGGEACASSLECESQSCNGTSCEAIPSFGQPCSSLCADELVCISGVCGRLPGVGESCADSFLCAEGLACDDGVCERPGSTSGESLLCSAF